MIVAKTILVFALLGPPVGLQVLALGFAATHPWPSPPSLAIGNLIFMMIAGIPLSYIFGIVPAIAVGTSIAIGEKISMRFGFLHVFLIGFLCGCAFLLTGYRTSEFRFLVVVVLTFLLPTIICWRISRRWRQGVSEQTNESV